MQLKITSILLLLSSQLFSQSIQRSVIGSAGQVTTSGAYKLSSTVGETVTKKVSASGLTINQGFQQNKIASTPLPITGLEFTAMRLNNSEVKLTWKTLSEISNKGFTVERQFDNESDFSSKGFVESNAINGNSFSSLSYSHIDLNNYEGVSYYRLKQEDIDGKFIYSMVRTVKGESTDGTTVKIWPMPSSDYFNLQVNGISKDDQVIVLDLAGKVVQQLPISNNKTIQVRNLIPGTYIIRLASDKLMSQKVVVQ